MQTPRPTGWIPEEAIEGLPGEHEAAVTVITTAAELAKRGGALSALGRALRCSWDDVSAILLTYRIERVQVRRALGLPSTATTADVLAALQARKGA